MNQSVSNRLDDSEQKKSEYVPTHKGRMSMLAVGGAALLATLIGTGMAINTRVAIAQSSESAGLEIEDFEFWADQCQTLTQTRQYEDALAACEEAIALNDDLGETVEVWTTRGEILVYTGQYEDALVSLGLVLEERPEYSLAMTYQCAAQRNLGHYQDAVDICEEALLLDGNWGQRSPSLAWYYRGLALQQQGFLETALESFERAIWLNSVPDEASLSSGEPNVERDFDDSTSSAIAAQNRDELTQWLIENQPSVVYGTPTVEEPLVQAEWCNTLHLLGQSGKDLVPSSLEPCGLDEAIQLYELALVESPQDTTLWQQQGFALEQVGDYDRALIAYDQALTLTPDHPHILTRQCGVLNQLERYEEALAACETALQNIQPRSSHEMAYRLNQHSVAFLGLEQYEEALTFADRAIAILPSYAAAHNSRAVSLWQLNRITIAIESSQLALVHYSEQEEQFEDTFYRPNSDPWPLFYRDYGLAWFNRGRILIALGNQFSNTASDAYFQSLYHPIQKLSQHSENQFMSIDFGEEDSANPANATSNDVEQQISSEATYPDGKQFVSQLIFPVTTNQTLPVLSTNRFSDTLLNLAAVYIHNNRSDLAFDFASFAVQLDPESFEAWHNLGVAALRSDRFEEASYAFSIANRIEPENISVLMGIGEMFTRQRQIAEAIAAYEQILNINPAYAPAQRRLNTLMPLEQ